MKGKRKMAKTKQPIRELSSSPDNIKFVVSKNYLDNVTDTFNELKSYIDELNDKFKSLKHIVDRSVNLQESMLSRIKLAEWDIDILKKHMEIQRIKEVEEVE